MSAHANANDVALSRARLHLLVIWLSGAGVIFLILIVRTFTRTYQQKVQEVWGWALPTVLPTLSLILSVLGANALEPNDDDIAVGKTFYVLACILSGVYLLLIFVDLVVEPFTEIEPLELMKLSNLWLGPFQALVVSSIGVLFFTKKKRPS